VTAAEVASQLLHLLRETGQLSSEQRDEIDRLRGRNTEARSLARALIERGLATPFQINHIARRQDSKLLLGPYLLVERLGEGGMGQVFKAYHRVMQRHVALKIIRPEYCGNPAAIQRFLVELRALASVSHPNIIQVHDANEVDGTLYFAMEYVAGTDLGKLVKKQHPLPVARVCEWVGQAALGLQHAHEHGLVHRDLKPGNLLLAGPPDAPGRPGAVKILDLGLVRTPQGAGPDQAAAPLTHCGVIMGTPDYIAPEQILDAHGVDIRGDIYSLGCTLYHLLAGRPPFAEAVGADKFRCHQHSEPTALEALRSDVPPELAAVCRKMMAKDCEKRYQAPEAVARALRPFSPAMVELPPTGSYDAQDDGGRVANPSTGGPIPASPTHQATSRSGPRHGAKKWLWLTAALLVLIVGITVWKAVMSTEQQEKRLGEGMELANGDDGDQSVAPNERDGAVNDKPAPPRDKGRDDKQPVDKADPPDNRGPVVPRANPWAPEHHIKTLGDVRGRHWAPVRNVAYSPDGKWLATSVQHSQTQNRLYLWDAATLREPLIVSDVRFVTALTFAPDSKTLAVVNGGSIQLLEVQGNKLAKGPALEVPAETKHRHFGPTLFTPDGEGLLSWDSQGVVWRWQRKGKRWEARAPTQPMTQSSIQSVVSADGKTQAYLKLAGGTGKMQVWVKDLDQPKVEPTLAGSVIPIVGGMALSDDGRRLAFDSEGSIHVRDLTDGQVREWPDIKPPSGVSAVRRFSADGRFLLFTGGKPSDRPPNRSLWVCEVSQNGADQAVELKEAFAMAGAAAFSGDGTQLAVGGQDHAVRIWERDGKGWRLRPWFTGQAGPVRHISFSADGAHVVALSRSSDFPEAIEPSNLRTWEIEKDGEPRIIPITGWFNQARFAQGTQVVACGVDYDCPLPKGRSRRGFLGLWDGPSGREGPRRLVEPFDNILALSGDRKSLAVASMAWRETRLFSLPDLDTRGDPLKAERHECLALSSDGGILAVPSTVSRGAGTLQVIKFWDVHDIDRDAPRVIKLPEGKTLEFGKHITSITQMGFSADDKLLATLAHSRPYGTDAGHVWLWNLNKDSEPVVLLDERGEAVSTTAFALAPDGKMVATCDTQQTVALWDVAKGKKIYQWDFPGPVHSAAFDTKGERLATGNGDGTVTLLRVPGR
jgi:serine/threonine protein kinase/WD40 repeat protein